MEKTGYAVDRVDVLIPEDYTQPVSIEFATPVEIFEEEGKKILAFGMPKEHFDLFCKNYEENIQQKQD